LLPLDLVDSLLHPFERAQLLGEYVPVKVEVGGRGGGESEFDGGGELRGVGSGEGDPRRIGTVCFST
jgi:hypothetical protein